MVILVSIANEDQAFADHATDVLFGLFWLVRKAQLCREIGHGYLTNCDELKERLFCFLVFTLHPGVVDPVNDVADEGCDENETDGRGSCVRGQYGDAHDDSLFGKNIEISY